MKKTILGIFFLLLVLLFFFFVRKKRVETEFVGEYNFKIFNDSLFKNSYFHESFGYVISNSNLKSSGIKLLSEKEINNTKDDYIFTFNYPIKKIVEYDDGIDYIEKTPIKVELDSTKAANKIYVYRLKNQNKYRLILP